MKINEYQIVKGRQAEAKETELTQAEAEKERYRLDLEAVSEKITRIREAVANLPAIPTLSGLKAVVNAVISIVTEAR